jgi:hypothetical protein
MSDQTAVVPPSQSSCKDPPVVGEELLGPAGLDYGGKVTLSHLKVVGQPFSNAIYADIREIPGSP